MSIDITKLPKVALLKALVIAAKKDAYQSTIEYLFNENVAEELINNGYIDRYCGRTVKADLSQQNVDPSLYDREAGRGTFAKVVENLRSVKNLT